VAATALIDESVVALALLAHRGGVVAALLIHLGVVLPFEIVDQPIDFESGPDHLGAVAARRQREGEAAG